MSDSGIRKNIYEMFYKNKDYPLIDFLNNSSCDEIVEVDMNNDTYRQFYHVTGKYFVPDVDISYRELIKFTSEHIVHPDDYKAYMDFMNTDGFLERLKTKKIPNFDFAHFRYRLQGGDYRYVEQCVIAGEENGIAEGCFRIYIFDVHNLMIRKLGGEDHNEEGVISADRDLVTGLLNQKNFQVEANKLILAKRNANWCLISIDIEHFKFFDEWYGRETGDYLLARIGSVLRENEKKMSGIAGYFGQDDFVLFCRYNLKKIEELHNKIRDLIVSFGYSVGFMPAFGVARLEEGMMVLDALDRASIASSEAKKDIRKRICVYNTEMQAQSEKEFRIISDYMNAFKNDEITFFLQPQCRISSKKIVGAESLARWIKSDGTIVPPNDYIPVLEKYGFITDLDQRLWEKVCIWLRKCLDEGKNVVPISLNVSRADIFNIDVFQFFTDLTKKYNIPHKLLKLEITESAYAETSSTIGELVNKLRKEGFIVLMDDFGSGYSSLNMLSFVKVDVIKLDARFIHLDGGNKEMGVHILESVVNMSKQIAIPIVVEGVENQKQCSFLEELGVRYVQGFYFYRPMPTDKFEELISNKDMVDLSGFVVKINEQFRVREFLDKNIYSDSMLNSILGAVAIYSWKGGKHVDIIRFNQQFYETVNVPDFHERLENIDRFMPDEDIPKIFDAFKKAKANRFNGAIEFLRFYKTDGTLSTYRIRFYYLGRKEGTDRFYGAALNMTELADLRDEKMLVSEFSEDNLIFIRKRLGRWSYSVASHKLADVFGLSPKELEEEMNNGKFADRVMDREELSKFMEKVTSLTENKENFEHELLIKDKNDKPRKILLSFHCVSGRFNNIEYVMRTKVLD